MWSTKRALSLTLLACAATLGACAGAPSHDRLAKADPAAPYFDKDPKTPIEQYHVQVERRPEELALSVHATGLSANQQAALATFARNWRETGGDADVIVSAPAGPSAVDPQFTVAATAAALASYGVPSAMVRYAAYDAGGAPDAPVTARFEHYVASGPDCTGQWDNLLSTHDNGVSRHFGCATTANLAASIANPRDLVEMQAMTPADGLRRATVLDKYRKGENTSSAKDAQASGAISSVVR